MYPQVSLHLGFLHAAVNPLLHLLLDPSLRRTLLTTFFCRDTVTHTSASSSRKGASKHDIQPPLKGSAVDVDGGPTKGLYNAPETGVKVPGDGAGWPEGEQEDPGQEPGHSFNFRNHFVRDEFKVSEI